MKRFFYEKKGCLDIFDFSPERKSVKKYGKNISLEELFKKGELLDKDSVFLLNERFFSFFVFDFHEIFDEEITIKKIKDFVEQKKKQIYGDYKDIGSLLYYYIEDINVEGDFVDYVIGKKGEVFFRLKMIFLKKEMESLAGIYAGNKFRDKFSFYPQSFFTANFIKNFLGGKDINILYIKDKTVKFVRFRKGFYDFVDEMEFGLSSLKEIFKERDVLDLYYSSFQSLRFNQFTEGLIKESIEFYCQILNKWLSERISKSEKVFILSNILENKFFLDTFGKEYNNYIGGFVLPLKESKNLDFFRRKWSYDEMDILTALNNF